MEGTWRFAFLEERSGKRGRPGYLYTGCWQDRAKLRGVSCALTAIRK